MPTTWKTVQEYSLNVAETGYGVIYLYFDDGSVASMRGASEAASSAIVDTLRNEKPVRAAEIDEGVWSLATGREPTGEGE